MAIETIPSTLPPPTHSVFDSQAERPRPQDVGILGIEMYFPQRVSYFARLLSPLPLFSSPFSAFPRKSLKCTMVSRRASTPLASASLIWRSRMTGRTSTPWLLLVRGVYPEYTFGLTYLFTQSCLQLDAQIQR